MSKAMDRSIASVIVCGLILLGVGKIGLLIWLWKAAPWPMAALGTGAVLLAAGFIGLVFTNERRW